MSTEENKAVVRRFWDAMNRGDLKALEDTLAASYKGRMPGVTPVDFEGMLQIVKQYISAFPDLRVTIEDIVAEGDKVAARVTMTGTHQGEFEGVAATGKPVTVASNHIARVLYGRIVRSWSNPDSLGMLQQLGIAPMPVPAGA